MKKKEREREKEKERKRMKERERKRERQRKKERELKKEKKRGIKVLKEKVVSTTDKLLFSFRCYCRLYSTTNR